MSAMAMGLFTGGPGLNGGSHKVGSLTLPMSSGNTDRQIQFMMRPGVDHPLLHAVLCGLSGRNASASAACRIRFKLKAGIFGAEAWTRGDAPGYPEEARHQGL